MGAGRGGVEGGWSECRALVVGGFPTTRRIIKHQLRDLGFGRVAGAAGVKGALQSLASAPCDLVIGDWDMTSSCGLDLVRALRADERLADLPFLMVTSESHRDEIIDALRNGANGYLVRPFTADALREKVAKVCRGEGGGGE